MASTPADASSSSQVVGEKSNKMIMLISSYGQRFDVTEAAAAMSDTIKHMIDDDCTDNGILIPNVTANILSKVIEYCNKHAATDKITIATSDDDNNNNDNTTSTGEQDLKSFDASFVAVDRATLFDIILAANYLSIKWLLDLGCQTVADIIKDFSPEEVRKVFNVQNDFTPNEEKEIREANAWAFQ